MAGMTKAELTEFIKEQTVPLIAATVGKDVADQVRQAVEAALKGRQASDVAGKLFGQHADQPPAQEREPGTAFARCLRAVAGAKMSGGGPEKAIDILRGWGDPQLADEWVKARVKAQAAGDATSGGFLVPTQFSTDVIELLRPQAVVRGMNPTIMPMPTGTLKVPKITDGTAANYVGENQNIGKTQASFGQITLAWKKLACLVPISNDLIRFSSPQADAVVRDDVVRAMAQREDQAFIRDDGTSGTPKGIKNWIHADNLFNANQTVNLANVTADLGNAIKLLMAANIPLVMQQNPVGANAAKAGWIISPRTYKYLTTLQNANGFYAYRDEMLRGSIWGFPYRVTTLVQETLGTGAQTEIYFGAFAHAVIGESLGLMVDASQEAAYHDGSNVVAAFSQDQTVIRVLAEHDFCLRHEKSFALIGNVTWS